jgi:type II secretory ATPase GspE/PulE/Tfp pilus assembly ATPase PilB-like protein
LQTAAESHLPDARPIVHQLLLQAIDCEASDIHRERTGQQTLVRFRMDGLLETVPEHDSAIGRAMISRLMVMTQLLTYRLDIPREGRIAFDGRAGRNRISPSATQTAAAIPMMNITGLKRMACTPAMNWLIQNIFN